MPLKSMFMEPGTDDVSSTRVILAFVFGIVFAFWTLGIGSVFLNKINDQIPVVLYDDVDGYLEWAIASFVPAIALYFLNRKYGKTKNE